MSSQNDFLPCSAIDVPPANQCRGSTYDTVIAVSVGSFLRCVAVFLLTSAAIALDSAGSASPLRVMLMMGITSLLAGRPQWGCRRMSHPTPLKKIELFCSDNSIFWNYGYARS